MNPPSREQQRAVVRQWRAAAGRLAATRNRELSAWVYDAATVNALLDIGARSTRHPDEPNGLVEMQRRFLAIARRRGLLPLR